MFDKILDNVVWSFIVSMGIFWVTMAITLTVIN